MRSKRIDVDVVKQRAAGRWREILTALGGLAPDFLHFDRREGPCPKCGGDTRYRGLDESAGALFCSHCHNGTTTPKSGDGIAALRWLRGWDFNQALAELSKYLGVAPVAAAKPNGTPKIIATYNYTDEQGTLLYQVVRYAPKDFRQRRPDAGGDWVYSVKNSRLVPYRLRELLATPMDRGVLVVEGEKDVDRAASINIVATTCAMGAGKWRAEYNEHFRGRSVYIIPDNDKPGREHAQQVAMSLHGIAKNIKVVELPGVPEKGDLSDWLDQGHTRDELVSLVKAAPEWMPAPADKQPKPATGCKKPEPPPKHKKPEPPPFVPFPTDALPRVAADFIHQGGAALGCDESYIALPLLSALAAAVGNTRRIRLKRDWREPCILWTIIVGDSGTLKSPALDLALAPIRKVQDSAFAEYIAAMEQYRPAKATHDADLAEWKKKGRKTAELPPTEPEEPVPVRYVANDTTVEALAVLLQEQPRGLLVANDELSGWINSFDAYKACRGKDVAHWLSMHRAGALMVDRKTGRRLIHVPRAAVCIAGGIQPRALKSALVGRYEANEGDASMDKPDREHFDNGLAARLLLTMPPRLPKQWTEDSISDETEAAMADVFHRLLDLQFDPAEPEPAPIDLALTPKGKDAWVRFYNEHAREQVNLTGDLAAVWSKLEGYAARFALLVHLIRVASSDTTVVDAAVVDEASIAAGVAISRWFGDEAGRVYKVIGGDGETPEARAQRELVRIMQNHGGEITVRQLMQASRKYRKSAEDAEAALGQLVVAGIADAWVDVPHGSCGGRPTTVFTLVKTNDGNTTAENPEETEVVLPLPPVNKVETQSENHDGGEAEWTA